jgi:hypothetical protein
MDEIKKINKKRTKKIKTNQKNDEHSWTKKRTSLKFDWLDLKIKKRMTTIEREKRERRKKLQPQIWLHVPSH